MSGLPLPWLLPFIGCAWRAGSCPLRQEYTSSIALRKTYVQFRFCSKYGLVDGVERLWSLSVASAWYGGGKCRVRRCVLLVMGVSNEKYLQGVIVLLLNSKYSLRYSACTAAQRHLESSSNSSHDARAHFES